MGKPKKKRSNGSNLLVWILWACLVAWWWLPLKWIISKSSNEKNTTINQTSNNNNELYNIIYENTPNKVYELDIRGTSVFITDSNSYKELFDGEIVARSDNGFFCYATGFRNDKETHCIFNLKEVISLKASEIEFETCFINDNGDFYGVTEENKLITSIDGVRSTKSFDYCEAFDEAKISTKELCVYIIDEQDELAVIKCYNFIRNELWTQKIKYKLPDEYDYDSEPSLSIDDGKIKFTTCDNVTRYIDFDGNLL